MHNGVWGVLNRKNTCNTCNRGYLREKEPYENCDLYNEWNENLVLSSQTMSYCGNNVLQMKNHDAKTSVTEQHQRVENTYAEIRPMSAIG